jgi:hypothetical protein
MTLNKSLLMDFQDRKLKLKMLKKFLTTLYNYKLEYKLTKVLYL